MRRNPATPDQIVAGIAARQHGVVRLDQLRWAGLSHAAVQRRVGAARLHRLYRGVFSVGHTNLSKEGQWIAAVFACGEGAVLSHESAAHLWGISPRSPSTVHVTVPGHGGRERRGGIALHRSRTLTAADTVSRKNIPITTRARTLADLRFDRAPTRSGLERLFLRLCRDYAIPKPEVNVRLGPYTVDFLWRAERLVVELDSYAYHSDRATFRSDRERDRELKRRGLAVLRFADDELAEQPLAVISSLRAHIRAARRVDAA